MRDDLGARGRLAVGVSYLDKVSRFEIAPPLAPAGWDRFDASDLTIAARAWSARAVQERRSAAVFATISSGLASWPVSLGLSSALARIVVDELRHADLCRRMAVELGGTVEDDDLGSAERRLRPPGRAATNAALSLLLIEGAVGETISAAIFAATRAVTEEPRTHSALSVVLRDEVRHARTCWEALAALTTEMEADLPTLGRDLSHEMGVVEIHSVLPALKRGDAGDLGKPEHAALGILPPLRRVEVFYATWEGTIIPRLRKLGIDGKRIWAERYESGT
jgi:hypothetical protein